MEDERPEVTIYTDGCCLLNPGGAGGWGAVLQWGDYEKPFSGYIQGGTTSGRAELIAIIEALKCLKVRCKVTLYSDSQNTVNVATGMMRRRSNLDLWALFDAQNEVHEVTYIWIKGHNGNLGNEAAHKLAERAAKGIEVNHD